MAKRLENFSINKTLLVFFGIVSFSALWIYLIPAAVANAENVFYERDVKSKALNARYAQVISEVEDTKRHDAVLQKLNAEINSASPQELSSLIESRNKEEEYWQKHKKKSSFAGCESNLLNHIWFINYICLGVLGLILVPDTAEKPNLRSLAVLTILVFVGFQWPNWVRNIARHHSDRVIFSWVHFEFAPMSFLLQELRILIWCLGISFIWERWSAGIRLLRSRIPSMLGKSLGVQGYTDLVKVTSDLFSHWQYNSIALAGVFLPFSYFYWYEVSKAGDRRFIVSALLLQIIWAITWLIVSFSLVEYLKRCSQYRLDAIAAAMGKTGGAEDQELLIKIYLEITPLSNLPVLASSVAAVVSFASPAAQLLS